MEHKKLKIGGILDISTIDYPGKLTSVIFLHGCNFRCPFCFNPELVLGKPSRELHVKEIIEKISNFRDFIDAVVITGGEPTLQPLEFLCKELRKIGLFVKIDTNGSNPDVIENLIRKGLIDFVALDIKAPFSKYSRVIGNVREQDVNNIKKTFEMLLNFDIDYECRTPVVPNVNMQHMQELAEDVKPSKVFVLEQFKCEKGTLSGIKGSISREELVKIAKMFSNKTVKIRTAESGEEVVA